MRVVSEAEQDRLSRPGEVAERLACSLSTLDVLDELGVLPKIRILSTVRYRESDVVRVIRDGAPSRRRAAA